MARHPEHPAGCTGHPSTEVSIGEELCPQGSGQGRWWGTGAGVTARAQLRKRRRKGVGARGCSSPQKKGLEGPGARSS